MTSNCVARLYGSLISLHWFHWCTSTSSYGLGCCAARPPLSFGSHQLNSMLRPHSVNADDSDVDANKELSRPWRNN
jgi:hypothetical protein